MADLLNELRSAIRESGDIPATIAERAGLPRSALSRLLAGKSCTVEGAEKIAAALGMEIRLGPKRPRTERKGR